MLLKTKAFHKWAQTEKLSDKQLITAIMEINNGLIDATLGGGLIKKRIRKRGFGKRGGFRTLLAFRRNSRSVFLFGFSKSERENITDKQHNQLTRLAKMYLELSQTETEALIKNNELIEVKTNEKTNNQK